MRPQLEPKCANCGKGKGSHSGNEEPKCPLKVGNGFSPSWTFKDSGKPTLKSKRAVQKWKDDLQAEVDRLAFWEAERNKKRAMTYEQTITATVELLTKITGLGVIVERAKNREYAEIILTTLGGEVHLGRTSVSVFSMDGRTLVGGMYAGAFMYNADGKGLHDLVRDAFRDLEQKANGEVKDAT